MNFSILEIEPLNQQFVDPIYPVRVLVNINGQEFEEVIEYNRSIGLGSIEYNGLSKIMELIPKVYQNTFRESIRRAIFETN